MSHSVSLRNIIASLLFQVDLKYNIEEIEQLFLGGNNRAYKVHTSGGVFFVKQYFIHTSDLRDRLHSEYAFLAYAAQTSPNNVPIAHACDKENGFALYEFIEGKPINSEILTLEHIDIAARFFCDLNISDKRISSNLPLASEACFSIMDHIKLIDLRVKKLKQFNAINNYKVDINDLINRIEARLKSYVIDIKILANKKRISLDKVINSEQRCISPSDFGFHNALIMPSGNIKFIDFEYAGWDDPAKMIGDFFSQLAVPVGMEHFERFTKICLEPFDDHEQLFERACMIRPLYQIKWCCIALNVFIPVHMSRRKFAKSNQAESCLKTVQFAKAEKLLQSI
jgi:thiamine kinase-like enzyme